jgi:hypothetical protein
MQVRTGWNTEMGRKKFDVTLEESDLGRMLLDNGIPTAWQGKLKPAEVFQLMYLEADRFAKVVLADYFGRVSDDEGKRKALAEADASQKTRDSIFAQIKTRLGLTEGT